MTLRELIDAIDREAERALVGYPLDLDAEVEVKGRITIPAGPVWSHEVNFEGRTTRLEREGGRVFVVIE